jgi:hypothetical protein
MSDLLKIFLTAALTLFGGTLLLVFGEFVKVLVVVPLQKYREHVQVTRDRLDFYANQITNFFPASPSDEEWDRIRQISRDLRSAATQLSSKYAGISSRRLLIKMKIIPSAKKLAEAYGSLIFLSNSIPRHGERLDGEHDPIIMNNDHIERAKAALMP